MDIFRSAMVIVTLAASLSFVISKHNLDVRIDRTTSVTAERESELSTQLTQKGQQLLEAMGYSSARVVVSVRCCAGSRKQNRQLLPGVKEGSVVTGLQEKAEKHRSCARGKDRSTDYSNVVKSEKRECARLQQEDQESLWVERISVCAVVAGRPSTSRKGELQEALGAALGLDASRGDTVRLVVRD